MEIRTAQRKKAKIRLGLQGPSGSGKTYSSLLMARGLVNDWSNIAVIDTQQSADLYAHLRNYHVLNLSKPYFFNETPKSTLIDAAFGLMILNGEPSQNKKLTTLSLFDQIGISEEKFMTTVRKKPCYYYFV